MNKMICRMALALAVAGLAGCGLKGPLYFPPPEKPQQQTTPAADESTRTTTESGAVTTPAQNTTQNGTSTSEPGAHSPQ